jgi:hypothetical protein
MVRFSLKYNLEKKEHEWKVLDEKRPGLIIVETAHGTVTIPNYPLDGEAKTVVVGENVYRVFSHMVHRWASDGHQWTGHQWTILSQAGSNNCTDPHFKNLEKNEDMKFHPLLKYMWCGLYQLYNPIRQQWVSNRGSFLNDETAAVMDVIEHDIIEYVSKTIPQVNATIAAFVADRVAVEKEMSGIEKEVKPSSVDNKESTS